MKIRYLFFLGLNGTKNEFIDKYKKRFKSLVIPYLFWSSIWILIYLCLQYLPQTKPFFAGKPIRDFSIIEFLNTLFLHPIPFQLWFIKDLIVLVLLSPIFYFLIKNLKYLILLPFLVAWYFNFDFYILESESILFFLIGSLISILKHQNVTLVFEKKHSFLVAIWILICLASTILDFQNFQNAPFLVFLHKIGILVGIPALWILYDFFVKGTEKENQSTIYSFSFFIFAFHLPMMTFVRAILFKFGHSNLISFSIYIFAPLIVIVASLVVAYLIQKATPNFYKIINGGR